MVKKSGKVYYEYDGKWYDIKEMRLEVVDVILFTTDNISVAFLDKGMGSKSLCLLEKYRSECAW